MIHTTWIYSYQGRDFWISEIRLTCDVGNFTGMRFINQRLGLDDRINWQHGDNLAAVYVRSDSSGDPALHIYCVDAESRGTLGAVIPLSAFETVGTPDHNTLVQRVESCRVPVAAYVLTTDEYQVNIGPDAGGTIEVLIWRGLPVTGLTMSRFDER